MPKYLIPQSPLHGIYPTNHVTAVFDDITDAKQAVEKLRQAGFDDDNIVLITNSQVVDLVKYYSQHQSLFNRLEFIIAHVVSDEKPFRETYIQAAQDGCHILHVHTHLAAEQSLAASIMKECHGQSIKFFGQWAITDYL